MKSGFAIVTDTKGNYQIVKNSSIHFTKSPLGGFISYLKGGLYIAESFFNPEMPISGNEEEIIEKIHDVRYSSRYPYVITGGHFHQIYVRNLGIFFNALLDPRIPSTESDWDNRQRIVLKTLAIDLEIFRQAKKDYTTIVPLEGNTYTCLNIYSRASDSLFGMLYALCALHDEKFVMKRFPASVKKVHVLKTQKAAQELISEYSDSLQALVEQYLSEILDKESGLIKKNINLCGARDGIKRDSSFYDNVIAWSTAQLATQLGILDFSDSQLKIWKENILDTFWDESEGIFLDDLSDNSIKDKTFCSDSFIVTSSLFLDFRNPQERRYLEKMTQYVENNQLDTPFPIWYSKKNNSKRLYLPVRIFASTYAGRSIWSHWGMEYIKTLILLGSSEKFEGYLKKASMHLESYKRNIEKYGGYPELYDIEGKPLSSRLYKGVLHNGWVINYEQAKMMLDNI